MTQPAADSLRLELVLPPRVRAGQRVRIKLRVQNLTERTLDLYLRGRAITFDVVITRAAGDIVWQRLEDAVIPAIVQLRALVPGEALELTALWNGRTKDGKVVGPGAYTARGLLLVEGEPLETAPVAFRIIAG